MNSGNRVEIVSNKNGCFRAWGTAEPPHVVVAAAVFVVVVVVGGGVVRVVREIVRVIARVIVPATALVVLVVVVTGVAVGGLLFCVVAAVWPIALLWLVACLPGRPRACRVHSRVRPHPAL